MIKHGGFMSKVVFKENCKEAVRWFWLGRPESKSNHKVNMGNYYSHYELY